MAAINMNTNFADAFQKHLRIRTTNLRGSLLHTSVHTEKLVDNSTKDWPNADAGGILYICPIPFTCSIKGLTITAKEKVTALKLSVGIAGVNTGGSFTTIKDDLITNAGRAVDAAVAVDVWNHTLNHKTLNELLRDNQGKPIDTFKPYVDDKYGILFFKVTTQEPVAATEDDVNAANLITETNIDIEWVEQSPSTTSQLSAVIPNVPSYIKEAA